jgi:hypothetical protein
MRSGAGAAAARTEGARLAPLRRERREKPEPPQQAWQESQGEGMVDLLIVDLTV